MPHSHRQQTTSPHTDRLEATHQGPASSNTRFGNAICVCLRHIVRDVNGGVVCERRTENGVTSITSSLLFPPVIRQRMNGGSVSERRAKICVTFYASLLLLTPVIRQRMNGRGLAPRSYGLSWWPRTETITLRKICLLRLLWEANWSLSHPEQAPTHTI